MTLAMAYAETGDYKEAVRLAKKSLDLMGPDSGHREDYERILRQFERGAPHRIRLTPANSRD